MKRNRKKQAGHSGVSGGLVLSSYQTSKGEVPKGCRDQWLFGGGGCGPSATPGLVAAYVEKTQEKR